MHPPGSSGHGILQARILEWVAILFSRGSSPPRDRNLVSLIKDRNGMDLTEAENIKKRWQEYTEELYKKNLHDQDNHDGVIPHLKTDILEC